MVHKLKFAAHSGLGAYEVEEGELADCRLAAAKLLRRRRKTDHPCSTLQIGKEWEISEPEDCLLVPDTAGMLWIEEVPEPEQDADDDWEDDDRLGFWEGHDDPER